MGIGPGEPGPGAEVLVLLAAVDDDAEGLAAKGLEDAAATVPLGVLARGVVVGDPPVVEGEARGPGLAHEGRQHVEPPVLEAADAGVGAGIAADLVPGPGRPLGPLEEGQRGVGVGHELEALRGGVVEHGLERGRDLVAPRVPLALAELLAEAEPEEVLPAPGIGVVLEAGQQAVGRGVEEVRNPELGGPVHDALVLLDALGGPNVDLVVVLAPGNVDADAAGRMVEEERSDAVGQGADLVGVDRRRLAEVCVVVGDEGPLGDGLGREARPAEVGEAEAEAVRGERAVGGAPVHVGVVGDFDGTAGALPIHERVLEEEEEAPGGRAAGRRLRGRETEQGPEAAA